MALFQDMNDEYDINTEDIIEIDENPYYILPKGTTIYHGSNTAVLNDQPTFFAFNYKDASKYGQVKTFKTNRNLHLLALMELEVKHSFYKNADDEWKRKLRAIFGTGDKEKYRYSKGKSDRQMMKYLCDNTIHKNKKWDGYAMNSKYFGDEYAEEGFHAELVLCNPVNEITLIDSEKENIVTNNQSSNNFSTPVKQSGRDYSYDPFATPGGKNRKTKKKKTKKSKKSKKSKTKKSKKGKTKKSKRKQKGGNNIDDCINKEDPILMEELDLANMVKFKVRDPTKEDNKIYNCYNRDTLKEHIQKKIDLKVSKDDIKDPLTNKTIDEDFIRTNYPELLEAFSELEDEYDEEMDPYNYDNDLTDEQRSALMHHEYIFREAANDYVYTFPGATKSVTKRSTPQEIFDWYTELEGLRSREQLNRQGGKTRKKKKSNKRKSKKRF